jgi:hypothetical protein
MRLQLTTFLFLWVAVCFSQDQQKIDSLRAAYTADMRMLSGASSKAYYPHQSEIYSSSESLFLKKVDSLQHSFPGRERRQKCNPLVTNDKWCYRQVHQLSRVTSKKS